MLEPVSTNSSKIMEYIVFIAIEDTIYRDFFTGSDFFIGSIYLITEIS